MAELIQAEEVARLIPNGASVAVGGLVGSGHPEAITAALGRSYEQCGRPRDLTLIFSAGQGDGKSRGLGHFAQPGMLRRVIGGHWNWAPALGRMAVDGEVEAYNLPQGTLTQLFHSIAGKKPGVITKVGLNTYVDPRVEGGKLNSRTTEELVQVLELGGEEWLWYKPFPITVALLRGTTADSHGNVTTERESALLEILTIAQAARNCGGIVVVQVERMVPHGTLNPSHVKIPGILVDYIVVAQRPEEHMQTYAEQYNPSFSGEARIKLSEVPPMPLSWRKVVARRAAMELTPNVVVNLGIGVPEGVANVANEENVSGAMTLTVEAGGIGGVPAGGLNFGAVYNAEALVEHSQQFDFYDGGGLDIAFLGLAQTDGEGNINVSKFNGRVAGSGGFINISQNAKKVVFCGSFTTGGLEVAVQDGGIRILREGSVKKFVSHVEQITFSGKTARQMRQQVLYVTERAVFRLLPEGMVLTEIAPGVSVERDILPHMEFQPIVSKQLKQMDARLFREEKLGLAGQLAEYPRKHKGE